MPLQQLFVLAVAGMVFLAVMRVLRVRYGRTPHPEGMAKLLFGLAFVSLPPLALGLTGQAGASGVLGGFPWIPVYAIMLVGLLIVMWVAALVVAAVAPRRLRRLLLLALIAHEVDSSDVPSNPPVTPQLAAIAALVQRSNDVFPRGMGFAAEIDRPGFRASWDALDAETGRLEAAMAEDQLLGRGVASAVTALARDARSRLDTLRRLSLDDGQSWVPARLPSPSLTSRDLAAGWMKT
jgi:hypothetical protein